MRKKLKLIVTLPILILFFSFGDANKEPVGNITFYVGRVFVIPSGTSELSMAQFNMDIFPGDKVETKKESRCEITLKTGDVIRVDANSLFTLEMVEGDENSTRAESTIGWRSWSS